MFERRMMLAFLALCAGAACEKGAQVDASDPKARLGQYISKSFEVRSPSDRKELLALLTGDARSRLEAWSDEQFSEAFIQSKREFIKLAFQEVKEISPDEISITYELVFKDQGKTGGRDAKVTNKKLCQMARVDGAWMIKSVRNIKELIEYENELSLP